MKRILAIAILTVREHIRSRIAVPLLLLILSLIAWLEFTVQGDGTLAGQIRVFMSYSTGAATSVLGLATLWLAASCVASEVSDRTLQTVAVKPVRSTDIWIGKWLGLLAINAAIILAAGTWIGVRSMAILHRGGDFTDAQRAEARRHALVCRLPIAPLHEANSDTAQTVCDEDDDTTGAHRHESMAVQMVPPGGSRRWKFDVPREDAGELWVQFHFDYGSANRMPMNGVWTLCESGATSVSWSAAVSNLPAGRHRLEIPSDRPLSGNLTLAFTSGPADEAGVVVFRAKSGVLLLCGASEMPLNLLRAMLIALLKLSVLAAAGLLCSAMFTTPVATFAATALAVMTLCIQFFLAVPEAERNGPSCGHDHGPTTTTWYEDASESFTRATSVLVEPFDSFDGIGAVSDGLAVPWALVGRAVAVLMLGYVLPVATLGVVALRRRELADI